jgi:hypothetical protein
MTIAFDDVVKRLAESHEQPEGAAFRQALQDLRTLAEVGHVDAARELADQLAYHGPNHDPEAAYKWYYVSLSRQGFSVGWDDRNGEPPDYCGPVGDFRNESMASALVTELGWDKVRQLDAEAARWLAAHDVKPIRFFD